MTSIFGQEFLLAAKYPKFAIENLPAGRCGKYFSKEAGNAHPIGRAWAEQGTHPTIATQGLWRGGAHDYSGQRILTEGLKELEKFAKIASDFPNDNFQFSIFCEHKLKTNQLETVFNEQWKIVSGVQNLILVNTPMNGGDLLKSGAFGIPHDRLLNEIHGNWNPRTSGFAPYMWACDGLPAQDCDIQKFKNLHINALVIWLWMQQYNCKTRVDETTPIPQRKVKPVEKQVLSLEALIPNKGNVKFNKDSIYKSHADQHHDTPSPREQKPVPICAEKADFADRLEFIASNGKLVFKAERAGNYTDGRPLFRAKIWGFEGAEKAVKISGSPICSVIAVKGHRRVSLGTVHPAFRQNAWRVARIVTRVSDKGPIEGFIDYDEAPMNPDWV